MDLLKKFQEVSDSFIENKKKLDYVKKIKSDDSEPKGKLNWLYDIRDSGNSSNFEVRIDEPGLPKISYKFNDFLSAVYFKNQSCDNIIESLKKLIAEDKKEIDKLSIKIDANKDEANAIIKLINNLEKGDFSNVKNESGQKYISFDKTSKSGRYGVKFLLKGERIRDKRFPDIESAVKYRDQEIPSVINELKDRLLKLGYKK